MQEEETVDLTAAVIGEWVDEITVYDADGNPLQTLVYPPQKNLITIGISTLMAGLIQGTYTGNQSYWAVGTGSQPAVTTLTTLVAEINRQQVTINFVDPTNAVITTPGNRIVMTANWAKGALGTVTLTEFGLFGGTGAASANGGQMMDYVSHAPISVDSTISLSRKIYFTF